MLWVIVLIVAPFVLWKVFESSGTTKREQDPVERQVQAATPEQRKEMRERSERTLTLATGKAGYEVLSSSDRHDINVAIEILTELDAHEEGAGDDQTFRLRRRREYQQTTKRSMGGLSSA